MQKNKKIKCLRSTVSLIALSVLFGCSDSTPTTSETSESFKRAVQYRDGTVVIVDYKKANEYFIKAAAGGNRNALAEVMKYYDENNRFAKGLGYYETFTLRYGRYPNAREIAAIYAAGAKVARNQKKALYWENIAEIQEVDETTKEALAGSAEMQYKLAVLYKDGIKSKDIDKTKVFDNIKLFAEGGNVNVRFTLGYMYFTGTQVEQNIDMGISLLASSTDDGKFMLSDAYYSGNIVEKNIDTAFKYLDSAAKLNDARWLMYYTIAEELSAEKNPYGYYGVAVCHANSLMESIFEKKKEKNSAAISIASSYSIACENFRLALNLGEQVLRDKVLKFYESKADSGRFIVALAEYHKSFGRRYKSNEYLEKALAIRSEGSEFERFVANTADPHAAFLAYEYYKNKNSVKSESFLKIAADAGHRPAYILYANAVLKNFNPSEFVNAYQTVGNPKNSEEERRKSSRILSSAYAPYSDIIDYYVKVHLSAYPYYLKASEMGDDAAKTSAKSTLSKLYFGILDNEQLLKGKLEEYAVNKYGNVFIDVGNMKRYEYNASEFLNQELALKNPRLSETSKKQMRESLDKNFGGIQIYPDLQMYLYMNAYPYYKKAALYKYRNALDIIEKDYFGILLDDEELKAKLRVSFESQYNAKLGGVRTEKAIAPQPQSKQERSEPQKEEAPAEALKKGIMNLFK